MKKFSYKQIISFLFIIVLAFFFLGSLFMPDKDFSESENRSLQEAPSFSLGKYMEGRFEKKLENYVNDQFLLRDKLIKVKSAVDLMSGKVESNGVYKCKDNYLMEKLNAPEAHFKNTLKALKFFRRTNSDLNMYFLLAPNAANIYADKLPMTVTMSDQNKHMDDFFNEIIKYGYNGIDVRDKFDAEKNSTQLFYRTDHHWTSNGAYIAYKLAVQKMDLSKAVEYNGYAVKKDFKGTLYSKSGFVNGLDDEIKIFLPENSKKYNNSVIYYADTKKKTTKFYELDNLKKKDAYTVFGGSNHPIYTIQTPCDSKKNLLILKDSYANSLIPFLSQHYRRIVVVDPRYFYGDIKDIIDSNGIDDVLFLYNANTFFQDNSLEMMLR